MHIYIIKSYCLYWYRSSKFGIFAVDQGSYKPDVDDFDTDSFDVKHQRLNKLSL